MKSIFFSLFIWITALLFSFLGIFLMQWNMFVVFSFEEEFAIFNALQILSLLSIGSFFAVGIVNFITKPNKITPIIYTIAAVFISAINLVYLSVLMSKIATPITIINSENIITSVISNAILLPLASFCALSSIITMFMFKIQTVNQSKPKQNSSYSQISSPANQGQPMMVKENTAAIKEFNSDFTSTPNEKTYNMVDKLARLKEDISSNKFRDSFTETPIDEVKVKAKPQQEELKVEQEVPVENIYPIEKENIQVQNDEPIIAQNERFIEEIEEPNDSFNNLLKRPNQKIAPINNLPKVEDLPPIGEPKDPYKQTIVPRRSAKREGEFNNPIGNIAKPLYVERKVRRTPKLDENYQGKVFLGDSDRIWEAMKNQERRIPQRAAKVAPLNPKANTLNGLKKSKSKSIEVDLDKILDPVNEQSSVDLRPTIDWDE
ncbi:ABC-2 family transporter permease [Spiroplasma cantharicola]|uniref:Uncharacterized protein n=1 Tax=Spiroplasma cantharicola TaxID=362837 RepID=A0A0M5KJB8_9MOLU|nr:hypothetical protein [Spiroplasma cantharicola]ALD66693.1 hypothetical protein SCANT_v1c07870 [Spiroplasma cantharicola]